MALFAPKKGVNPHIRYANEYYRHHWFNKTDDDGIDFVHKVEEVSKKQAAHLLLEAGFKYYMGEKVKEYIRAGNAIDKIQENYRLLRFIRFLRRYAKVQGLDIRKIL